MDVMQKVCQACGKVLKGRADKKFCDDYCRNNYNNRQNSDQSNYARNINNVLRRNRRILEEQVPAGEEMKKVLREKLVNQGFNFKYHTHQYINQKGQVYLFNYDYGYLPLENDWLLIVKRKSEL